MKILVCISKAPDTTSKISFSDGNTKFDENGVQFIVNPYDEWYALVRALEIKESGGGQVTIITVGGAADDAVIRKALAIGADDAVRIDVEPKDAYSAAMQIANYAKENAYEMPGEKSAVKMIDPENMDELVSLLHSEAKVI